MNVGTARWTVACYAFMIGGAALTCISVKILTGGIKELIR